MPAFPQDRLLGFDTPLARLARASANRFCIPFLSSEVTPEVKVGVGRCLRRGQKAEAELEREAEPGEPLS